MADPLTADPRVHVIKAIPSFFEKLWDGSKTFEIRKNDRDYKVGDWLQIQEWDARLEQRTGREVGRQVTYMTDFSQMPGWVVMAVKP